MKKFLFIQQSAYLHLPVRRNLSVGGSFGNLHIIVGLAMLFITGFSFAQSPLAPQWDKDLGGTLEEELYALQQTTDGGYILGGWSNSGISGDKSGINWGYFYDYWIIKIDSLGVKQWDKDFGGTSDDELFALQQTADGGYILGGFSQSGIGGDKNQDTWGNWDYWIVKTDSLGNKLWDKDFGGTGDDELYSLQQTRDGGYILGGFSYSGVSGDKTQAIWGGGSSPDCWIVKIDSLGIKQWDKDFGGTNYDLLYAIQQTADGGYIFGGPSSSSPGGDKSQPIWGGGSDYWIVKIDSLGIKQWDKDFGGTGYEFLYSLQQTADHGYILGGVSGSGISGDKTQATCAGGNDIDYWIVKTDSLGIKQWDKDFGGNINEDDYGNVSQTSDGGYLLAGSSYSPSSCDKTENNLGLEQTWVIKTDSFGNKEWDKTLRTNTAGDDEHGLAIETKDNCYVMANFTNGGIGGDKTQPGWNQANYYSDYWIIKFCDTSRAISGIVTVNTDPNLSIYPNPSSGKFIVELSNACPAFCGGLMAGESVLTIQ